VYAEGLFIKLIKMKRILLYFVKKQRALYISLAYYGLGTLSVSSVYPSDLFYGEWSVFGLLFTFPVSILSFGYRFMEKEPYYPVLIIQFVMFVVLFLFLSLIPKKKKVNFERD
jgi:hypothetical protein